MLISLPYNSMRIVLGLTLVFQDRDVLRRDRGTCREDASKEDTEIQVQ